MSGLQRSDLPHAARQVNSEILDRQPPCNIEAELGVLGSILLLPHVCDEVAMIVRAEDFYDDANRKLFAHILAMHDDGRKVDRTLLIEELRKSGDFEAIGGAAFIAKVLQAVPNAAHAEHYARVVADKATSRALIHASTDILREAYDESEKPKELLGRAEQRIFSILDGRGTSTVADISEILHEAMDRIDARMKGEHGAGGTETGFVELDHLLGGLHGSELIVLAARPSMGKTALAMNIAEHAAIRQGVPTLFVSLEMASVELADRMLCSVAKVNGHRLRNGTISGDDLKRLVEKSGEISQAPLFVDDSPSRTVTEIAAAARRIRRREKALGLIAVDYLQLIEPDNAKDPRQEQVAKITRRLKGLAREMEVPVLCLAQLNRQTEATKDNRPRLSHLRESGAIEQDADVVMFVHREEYYHRGEEADDVEGQAEVIIAKQRNGPIGEVKLNWQKEYTRFINPASPRQEAFSDYSDPIAEF